MALIYQTIFPVNKQKTICDLASVITTWITGSPHRNIAPAELRDIGQDGFKFSKGHVNVESVRYEEGSEKIYAVRLVEKANAVRTTDIAGIINPDAFNLSVTHEYEALRRGDIFRGMSKPRLVRDVISRLGGGYDGLILETKADPHFVEEDATEFVAEIIHNGSDNKLPVVYISKNNTAPPMVNATSLAFALSGMAHVLVEPSTDFSYHLKTLTNGRNIFAGAVGIHWPNGMRHYITPSAFTGDVVQYLYEAISQSALNTIVPQKLSFDGIRLIHANRKFEQLRSEHAAAARTHDELLKMSEEERAKKLGDVEELLKYALEQNTLLQKQATDLQAKNACLEQRLVGLSNKRQDVGDMIKKPISAELYNGEIPDIVIAALRNYLNYVPDQSRRQDIIKATLDINKPTGMLEQICDRLKRAFSENPGNYSPAFGNKLRAIGFGVVEGANYPTIFVPGHEGRKVSLSKTPSDTQRTRKNEHARVLRDLFGKVQSESDL